MVELLKDYINKRLELVKVEATEKTSISAGFIAFLCTLIIVFAFFILLFNIGIAYLIGEALNNTSYGFLIVAGFYLILMIITLLLRKKIITAVANNVINFLKH